jgi:hypothetical protein
MLFGWSPLVVTFGSAVMSDLSSARVRKRTSVDSYKSMDFVLLCSIRVEGAIAKPSQRVRRLLKESWVQALRSVTGVGVAKSLARAATGPVVLLHIKKDLPQSRKPNSGWRSTLAVPWSAPSCFT